MAADRDDFEHEVEVGNATNLLIQAARISPPLMAAARLVDAEIRSLRAEVERLRTRRFIQVGWFIPSEDPADIRDHLVGLFPDPPAGANAEPVYRVKESQPRVSGSDKQGGAS